MTSVLPLNSPLREVRRIGRGEDLKDLHYGERGKSVSEESQAAFRSMGWRASSRVYVSFRVISSTY